MDESVFCSKEAVPGAFARTELLFGAEAMARLYRARVALFGLGGVGGYALEALARSGVGYLDLIDHDRVSASNLNRQILASCQTIGRYKTEAAAERVAAINPAAVVRTYRTFYTPQTAAEFDFTQYDYIIDAIDAVTGKLELATRAVKAGTPIISCMGAGNKLDPAAFRVADIAETSVCPLARIMRRELKRRGIYHLKVVYSREPPAIPPEKLPFGENGKPIPASNAFAPAAAGLVLAGEVIKNLAQAQRKEDGS